MHLTNYSINKFPDKVDPGLMSRSEVNQMGSALNIQQPSGMKANNHNEGECLDSSSMKSKLIWQCKRRLQHLLQPGKLGLGINLDPAKFWACVDEIVRNTIFALVPFLRVAYWAECEMNGMLDSGLSKLGEQPQCFQVNYLLIMIALLDYFSKISLSSHLAPIISHLRRLKLKTKHFMRFYPRTLKRIKFRRINACFIYLFTPRNIYWSKIVIWHRWSFSTLPVEIYLPGVFFKHLRIFRYSDE